MKMKKLLCMLLTVVMIVGMLAGCARTEEPSSGSETAAASSEPQSSSETTGNPDEVSQGVTDDTIKIGTVSLVSGLFAYMGQPAYDGFRAPIERLNAQGGVMGRKIEIVAYDDQFDAATGKATVERMVEQDKVFLLAALGSNIIESSLDYLKEKGIPVLNISSGTDALYATNDSNHRIFQIMPASMTCNPILLARVLHESVFGPNKDQKLPDDALIGVVHGVDSASMTSLGHLQNYAEKVGVSDRLITEAVTADTYGTAIQKLKNQGCQVVIALVVDATGWISAMDDAQWEVPVFFSYASCTLQSFVPETYKPGRPCYATNWGDPTDASLDETLDDMVDALSYCDDIPEDVRLAYRDNNYCSAGFATGIALVKALQRYNDHAGEYGLNWEDFTKIMELEPFFHLGADFDYANGNRMGVEEMSLFEYVGNPQTGEEELLIVDPLETLEEIEAK